MVQTATSDLSVQAQSGAREPFIRAYRIMLAARIMDDKMASLYRAGKIFGGVFLGRGQEALSVSLGMSLAKGDVYAPLIRDAAGRLAFGESFYDAARTYLGSALGPMRGRDGNVHRGKPREGLLPMISHLGAMIPVVNGFLMAHRARGGPPMVGGTSLGEGGTSTGAFHEALNQAAIEKLPLVLVVANNQYAYSTPVTRQFACAHLVDRAVGYGVAGRTVDGTDLGACLAVVGEAVAAARAGGGPQLVVGSLLRLCGHGEHDAAAYIDPELKRSPIGRDCLKVAESHLVQQGWADAAQVAAWREKVVREVDQVVTTVQREPGPDPYKEHWCALASKHLSEGFADV